MDRDEKKRSLKALLDAVEEVRRREGSGDDTEPGTGGAGAGGTEAGTGAGAPPVAPQVLREPAVGETLGGFRLIREIGRGGMGVVYEAEQLSLRRHVALKVLYPGLVSSERTLRRFRREAEAVARLSHPSIIPVYEIGDEDGTHFFAMRYLPGPDLAAVIEELRGARLQGRSTVVLNLLGVPHPETVTPVDDAQAQQPTTLRLPVRNYVFQAIERIAEVAEALEVAHRHDVVHRDVKPANLVFDRSGRLVLTDFGIAKTLSKATITRTGEFVGSPGYISPEQAMAKRVKVDHRTDIYSLGVTLYEFLTLKQPFLQETLEATLRAILTREPPPLRKLNPRLPKDVETVVLKAMEKDPDRRFASAGEMAAELRRILQYEAITITPAGAFTRLARAMRRNRAATTAVVSGVVLVGASLGVWQVLGRQREELEARGSSALEVADPEGRALVAFVRGEKGFDEAGVLASLQEARRKLDAGLLDETFEQLELTGARLALSRRDPGVAKFLPAIAEVKIMLIRRIVEFLRGEDTVLPEKAAQRRNVLSGYLDDVDPLVVKNAAVALGRAGGSRAVGVLADAVYLWTDRADYRDRGVDLRPDFIEALGSLAHVSAVDDLAELARHGDPALRIEAVWGLARISSPRARAVLEVRRGEEQQVHVRRAIERALRPAEERGG